MTSRTQSENSATTSCRGQKTPCPKLSNSGTHRTKTEALEVRLGRPVVGDRPPDVPADPSGQVRGAVRPEEGWHFEFPEGPRDGRQAGVGRGPRVRADRAPTGHRIPAGFAAPGPRACTHRPGGLRRPAGGVRRRPGSRPPEPSDCPTGRWPVDGRPVPARPAGRRESARRAGGPRPARFGRRDPRGPATNRRPLAGPPNPGPAVRPGGRRTAPPCPPNGQVELPRPEVQRFQPGQVDRVGERPRPGDRHGVAVQAEDIEPGQLTGGSEGDRPGVADVIPGQVQVGQVREHRGPGQLPGPGVPQPGGPQPEGGQPVEVGRPGQRPDPGVAQRVGRQVEAGEGGDKWGGGKDRAAGGSDPGGHQVQVGQPGQPGRFGQGPEVGLAHRLVGRPRARPGPGSGPTGRPGIPGHCPWRPGGRPPAAPGRPARRGGASRIAPSQSTQ